MQYAFERALLLLYKFFENGKNIKLILFSAYYCMLVDCVEYQKTFHIFLKNKQ